MMKRKRDIHTERERKKEKKAFFHTERKGKESEREQREVQGCVCLCSSLLVLKRTGDVARSSTFAQKTTTDQLFHE